MNPAPSSSCPTSRLAGAPSEEYRNRALIAVGGALAGGRFIAGLLFDTRATDPATLAGVVAATMVLALAAGIVPTRRAMGVEPIDALRANEIR